MGGMHSETPSSKYQSPGQEPGELKRAQCPCSLHLLNDSKIAVKSAFFSLSASETYNKRVL